MLDLTATSIPAAAPKDAGTAAFIRDTDTARFETDVIAASMKTPVIVDFWATWCGPCKHMMPMLEKVVSEAGGAVHLVKVDIDKCTQLAQIFRVQSVPMVYAFFQGQPVDGFMGAKPESELRAFVDKLKKMVTAPAPVDPAADIAPIMQAADKFFQAGDYTNAMAQYSTALDAVPDNMDALAGIGWCFIAQKEIDAVREILSGLSPEQLDTPRIRGLSFIVDAGIAAEGLDDIATLSARVEKDPKNLAVRFDLSRQLLAVGDIEGAIDQLVELTRRNREWEEQRARAFLLEILEALGAGHPLAAQGRRRLSSVLFS